MVELLLQCKRVINIDESWINSGNYHRKIWAPTAAPASATSKMIQPRLSLIAALDTNGAIFFSLTQVNTDSNVMMLFLSYLCRRLDAELGEWKSNSVILLDGAKYHTSPESIQFLRKLGVQVIYSGPYSYCKYFQLLH